LCAPPNHPRQCINRVYIEVEARSREAFKKARSSALEIVNRNNIQDAGDQEFFDEDLRFYPASTVVRPHLTA
jgi:hypothetical protein